MTSSPPSAAASPERRWLLKSALAISAVGTAFGGAIFWNRGVADGALTKEGHHILRAVTRAVLVDMLPPDPAQREAKLDAQALRLQEVINSMPTSAQQELSALLGLLANAPTRMLTTGLRLPWQEASIEEVQQALESMRIHPLPTTMISHHALRDLTRIAFFSIPDNWSLTGYPGPVEL